MTPTLLHAGNPGPFTGDGNWTYLIPGARPVLIDAGVGQTKHLDDIAAASPAEVIVTHAHSDHASGAPAIQQRLPQTRFSKMPWPDGDGATTSATASATTWHWLKDGDHVATGEGPLEVLHTPGHSPDHIALWHADSRTVFVGDLLQLGATVFIPASSGGSLAAYLQSLERLRALAPVRAWPAHGPVIEDPVALIDQYVAHRRQREEQVLAALQAGDDTVESITTRIYIDLKPALISMARESVLAHLVKLEEDGLIQRDEASWSER